MSDFFDELTAANAEFNATAGEPFTYDGASTGVGGLPLVGLFTEPDVTMQIVGAGEDADDELVCDVVRTLFASQPPAKKRLVYNGVSYLARSVIPVSGGLYRFRIYRTKPV